jgi:hypothetical protein
MSDTPHPQYALVRWLKLNLGLTMFGMSLISASAGFLVSATVRVTRVQISVDDSAVKVVALQANIVDIDHRLNDLTAHLADARRLTDQEVADVDRRASQVLADLDKRAAVTEARLAFIADRTARVPLAQPLPMSAEAPKKARP